MTEMDDQPLGPENVRYYSLLDSTDEGDMFTAYCDRHTQKMEKTKMPVKYDGALYELKEQFYVYTCPSCQLEAAQKANTTPKRVMFVSHMHAFTMWDEGESPADWFEYVGEYDESDGDAPPLIDF